MADLGFLFDATSIPNFGPEFDALPDIPALAELMGYRQWVGWTWTRRQTADGWRWTKPPVNAANGRSANVASPTTWVSYERAARAVDERELAGVGFVLTERDPYIGIDLDKCRNPATGEVEAWAQEILAIAETYAEISPSETGIRLIARGDIEKASKCDPAHVEIYDRGRYVTITGRHVPGSPTEIREAPNTLAALAARIATFRPEPVLRANPSAPKTERTAGSGRDFFRAVNDLALANLGVWVSELFPGARGSQKGYRITSKMLGRNLQEDLSITPEGAVDFGVHDLGDARDGKRTPIDLVLEYGGAPNATDAALWLCDRLDRDPADLGWEDRDELARLGAEIAEAIEEGRGIDKPSAPVSAFEPLPLAPPVIPAAEYPLAALGPILAPAAIAVSSMMQVPPALAAQSVLATASLAAQGYADVVLPFGQTRPLSLFFVTIAQSGDRKSSADREALRPIEDRAAAQRDAYQEEVTRWHAAWAAWNATKKNIEKEKSAQGVKLEKLEQLGPEPEKPLHPSMIANNVTLDGLLKFWPEMQGSLGLFTAEGGQIVGGHSMKEEQITNSAAILNGLWDGAPVRRVRAGEGISDLAGRRLALHVMIQPNAAAEFLANRTLRDLGTLARLLLAAPATLAGTRLYREPRQEERRAIAAYSAHLRRILARPYPLAGTLANELAPRKLPISPEATAAWIAFYNETETRLGRDDGLRDITDVASKAAENAARIAGVLAYIENPDAREVNLPAMQNAIALMRWYLAEAIRLNRTARVDPQLEEARRLHAFLLAQPGRKATFREIARNGPPMARTAKQRDALLTVLAEHMLISTPSKREVIAHLEPD